MNYLFEYLQLLSPDEITLLGSIDLPGREREVLDHLLSLRSSKNPSREKSIARLGISISHFDKTCSVLLRKIYAAIVPEMGTALLYDLNRRVLHTHFLHELRRQEKELRDDADASGRLADLYMGCFNLLGRIARKDYDERLMRSLARKYNALRPSPDNEIYFEANIIAAHIWSAAARGDWDRKDEILQRLRANEARITPNTGPLPRYRQCQACALYYGQIEVMMEERLRYLEMAVEICDMHPDVVSEEERVLNECKVAEAYYFDSRDFEKPWRLYADIFDRHPATLARDYYNTNKFVQLCIITGRYEQAEALLRDRFGAYLESEHKAIGTMGAISWAKLCVITGRLEEAKEYIDYGFRANTKNFYVQYEVELRQLETAYFLLRGDTEFTESLAAKHAKYLRSKGFTLKTSQFFAWYFKLVVALIDEAYSGRKLRPDLEEKLRSFMLGPAAICGIMLEKMREKILTPL